MTDSTSNAIRPIRIAPRRWAALVDRYPTRVATLASWGYQVVNVAAMMVIAPALLTKFGTENAGLWFFLLGCVTFFQLCEFGIGMSVSRQIAYSGHAPGVDALPEGSVFIPIFGPEARHDVFVTARWLFRRIAWLVLALAILAERTFLFAGHMSASVEGRVTWYLVVAAGIGYLLTRPYQVYLEGLLLQSWERLTVLGVTIAGNAALLLAIVLWPRLWVMGVAFAFGGWLQYACTAVLARRAVPPMVWSRVVIPAGLVKRLLAASWEQGVISIGVYMIISVNPLLIGWLLGPGSVPEYFLPWRAANAAQTALVAIFLPHLPFMIEDVRRGAHRNVRERLQRLLALGMSLAVAGYTAFVVAGPYLIGWWLHGTVVVPRSVLAALAVSQILGIIQTICWLYISAYGIQRFAHAMVGGAVLNVLLSVWMIPRWGVLGSVVATTIAQLLTSNWYTVWLAWKLSRRLGRAVPPTAQRTAGGARALAGSGST